MNLTAVICLLFMGAGVGILYLVLRRNPYLIPRGAMQWMSTCMCALLVALSGLIFALSWNLDTESHDEHLSDHVVDFEFHLISTEEKKRIREYGGQVVLLNFWATWCQPCITELPELDALQSAYRNSGLVVITVSDEDPESLRLYTDLLPREMVSGYVKYENLPLAYQNELANGRPVTYVIDGDGMIRERVRGAGNFAYFENLVTPWLAGLKS